MRRLFFKGKVAKRASNVELSQENLEKTNIKHKDNLYGTYNVLAFLHLPADNPNSVIKDIS